MKLHIVATYIDDPICDEPIIDRLYVTRFYFRVLLSRFSALLFSWVMNPIRARVVVETKDYQI